MKKYLIVFCFIFMRASCNRQNLNINSKDYRFEIVYSRSSGWTGWEYSARIDSLGALIINETRERPNKEASVRNYQLKKGELFKLLEATKKLSEVKLSPTYDFRTDGPTDKPVTSLKYRYFSKSGSTSFSHPEKKELPDYLDSLLIYQKFLLNKYDKK